MSEDEDVYVIRHIRNILRELPQSKLVSPNLVVRNAHVAEGQHVIVQLDGY